MTPISPDALALIALLRHMCRKESSKIGPNLPIKSIVVFKGMVRVEFLVVGNEPRLTLEKFSRFAPVGPLNSWRILRRGFIYRTHSIKPHLRLRTFLSV